MVPRDATATTSLQDGLTGRIVETIRSGGPIPFTEFLAEAMYGPDGYYSRKRLPIGPGPNCDFITASAISPVFGACTAGLLRQLDRLSGAAVDLFEAGPGNGDHLRAAVVGLDSLAAREPAADLSRRLFAWDREARSLPAGVEFVREVEQAGPIRGLVFSCELFDALPFHRLCGRTSGELGELWVDLDDRGVLTWREGAVSHPDLHHLLPDPTLAPGQIADLSPGWVPLYRRLARALQWGLLVTVDYGYESAELLDLRARPYGTLACYHRHRVHRDAFVHIGDQDITAHIDFGALREAGEAAGLVTVGWMRLAEWLTRLGIFDLLDAVPPGSHPEARQLLDLEGLGHDQRVLVQARGLRPAEVEQILALP